MATGHHARFPHAHFPPSRGLTLVVAVAVAIALGARTADALDTLYTFVGDSNRDNFGIAVSGAGDVNGDNFDDLIVGAERDDNNGPESGSARVLSGADGSTLYTFDGDSADDAFGASVSGAGDVNGDDFADVIVGAPRDDNSGDDSGMARVFSGADGAILYTFDGGGAGDELGSSVAAAGDINGDDFDDVIVGAPQPVVAGGFARIFSGANGAVLRTLEGKFPETEVGSSVAGAGDVN
ncbi:MAG: FG-GAP repeat protein, partial [Myxococcales bacterium]|nr:FG-GAP repeat protein [Myxococcales bacterium]